MFIWLIVDGNYEVIELKFFIPYVVRHNKIVCLPRIYIQQWRNLPSKYLFYILITKYLSYLLIFVFQKSKNKEEKPANQTQVKINKKKLLCYNTPQNSAWHVRNIYWLF